MSKMSETPRAEGQRGRRANGRTKETYPPLALPNKTTIADISDWLVEHRDSRRPLTVAAPLMAVVCWLHEHNYNFPTRSRLADLLKTGVDSIDSALSTALGNGEVSEILRTEPGEVAGRASIVRKRYIIPSQALRMVYTDSVKRSKGSPRVVDQRGREKHAREQAA